MKWLIWLKHRIWLLPVIAAVVYIIASAYYIFTIKEDIDMKDAVLVMIYDDDSEPDVYQEDELAKI